VPSEDPSARASDTGAMLAAVTDRMGNMHRAQVHRDPWPDFASFATGDYDEGLRRAAAVQWAGRARAEHGSIQQFTQLAHLLSEVRAPLHWYGALGRLVTDEARHAELCAEMAHACWPEGRSTEPAVFAWPRPRTPWPSPPDPADEVAAWRWAAEAIAIACCLGETLSRPMLEAIAVVATDPLAEACARQILRDEHLHATFGWEAMAAIVPRLSDEDREAVHARIASALGGFQKSTACGIEVADVAGKTIEIQRGAVNLGTLTDEQYAMIFYATLETEILPQLDALGLDGSRAWAERGGRAQPTSIES
jgi:hypothetical protein